ncbi:MAG: phosphoglycerate kinase, partial [Proteobacteria bacterium]|nr:phosphoglycerate kinase [Pseudomonadota bacterium]
MAYRTLDGVAVAGKRVLLRADLNVPLRDGKITDMTRLERLSPTIVELSGKGAKVIVLSHFDRPKGKRVESMSLRPVAAALGVVLGRTIGFVDDCVGDRVSEAVAAMRNGDVLVLENTRFYAGEEANDIALATLIATHGEMFVNDAFSAAHRAHATTEGIARLLPSYAGRLMQAELDALNAALGTPARPVGAIVGGSKVSTKLDLLTNLITKVDLLVIGGAMA